MGISVCYKWENFQFEEGVLGVESFWVVVNKKKMTDSWYFRRSFLSRILTFKLCCSF